MAEIGWDESIPLLLVFIQQRWWIVAELESWGTCILEVYKGCDVWTRCECIQEHALTPGEPKLKLGAVWMDVRVTLWLCPLTGWQSCRPTLKAVIFFSKSPGAREFHWHAPGKKMETWEGLSLSEFIFIEVTFQEGRLWTLLWALLIFVELYEDERLCKCSVLQFTETADDMPLPYGKPMCRWQVYYE